MFKNNSLIFIIAVTVGCSAFDLNDFTINPRIVQGENATRGQFPFYVFLKIHLPQGVAACGGSLISNEWVLTAGHCVNGAMRAEVHLGSLRARDLQEEGRYILNVNRKDIHLHPRYFQIFVLNDIGLIHLPQKVESTDTIKPISLSCNSRPNLPVTVIGNGLLNTTAKEIAPILQYTTLKTIPLRECLSDFPFLILRQSVICARGKQQRSACQGDSGGPLVSQENDALIGLTSFGSAQGCHLGFPQGYTNIPSYLPWIKEVTGISQCQE